MLYYVYRMKKSEKSNRGSIGVDEGSKGFKRESLLWNLEKQWKKLNPEERGIQNTKVYGEVHRGINAGLGKYSLKVKKTHGRKINMEFRSRLRMELSRYTKQSQLILNGVSQGNYRKSTEFSK